MRGHSNGRRLLPGHGRHRPPARRGRGPHPSRHVEPRPRAPRRRPPTEGRPCPRHPGPPAGAGEGASAARRRGRRCLVEGVAGAQRAHVNYRTRERIPVRKAKAWERGRCSHGMHPGGHHMPREDRNADELRDLHERGRPRKNDARESTRRPRRHRRRHSGQPHWCDHGGLGRCLRVSLVRGIGGRARGRVPRLRHCVHSHCVRWDLYGTLVDTFLPATPRNYVIPDPTGS